MKRALEKTATVPGDEEPRDACIQRFEYTFEHCWKVLTRQLEQELPNPFDIVDWAATSEVFRKIILKSAVAWGEVAAAG